MRFWYIASNLEPPRPVEVERETSNFVVLTNGARISKTQYGKAVFHREEKEAIESHIPRVKEELRRLREKTAKAEACLIAMGVENP